METMLLQAVERLRKKYLNILEEQILAPAKNEIENERDKILKELRILENDTMIGASDDRGIMENWLKSRLKRVEAVMKEMETQSQKFMEFTDTKRNKNTKAARR